MSKFNVNELRSVLCGDRIGQGQAREVFHLKTNVNFVVKIETAARSFQNISEWEIWSFVQKTPMEKWFAPCQFISNAGTILIQQKVEPLREKELPKRVPAFLADLKIENFGLFEGRFVCCDYGTGVVSIRQASKRLVKADWR